MYFFYKRNSKTISYHNTLKYAISGDAGKKKTVEILVKLDQKDYNVLSAEKLKNGSSKTNKDVRQSKLFHSFSRFTKLLNDAKQINFQFFDLGLQDSDA